MGDNSNIEWTDATWNPVTGCSKVSQGCKNCYAERLFPRVYGKDRAFTDVVCHEDRLELPLHWRRPRRIFVNSLSDLFHEAVPYRFIALVFATMSSSRRHTFQVLTKRPERMLEFFNRCGDWEGYVTHNGSAPGAYGGDGIIIGRDKWPLPHVQLGVSVEDQPTADERTPLLLQTPAAVHFLSYEPALGSVDWKKAIPLAFHDARCARHCGGRCNCAPAGLSWIIAGGESGPGARPPHPDWFRAVRDDCEGAGVQFFFKQWGEWLPGGCDGAPGDGQHLNCGDEPIRIGKKAAGRLLDGREWSEYPEAR